MSLNPRQRAHWISDLASELQRFISRGAGDAERPLAQQALHALQDARQAALASAGESGGAE